MKHIKLCLLALMAIVMGSCHTMKEASEAEIKMFNEAVTDINNQHFVVKGDRLVLNKRNFPAVTPSTNFVLVDGSKGVVQISPAASGGPNGVGGFTVRGTVSGYEVKTMKNGNVNVRFNVMESTGSCTVNIIVPLNSNRATVTIQNMFRGKQATLFGAVDDIDATVFEGRSPR